MLEVGVAIGLVVPLCNSLIPPNSIANVEHRRTAEQRERRYAAIFSRIYPYGLGLMSLWRQSVAIARPLWGLSVPQCTHGPQRVRGEQGLRRTAKLSGEVVLERRDLQSPTAQLSIQRSDEQALTLAAAP